MLLGLCHCLRQVAAIAWVSLGLPSDRTTPRAVTTRNSFMTRRSMAQQTDRQTDVRT